MKRFTQNPPNKNSKIPRFDIDWILNSAGSSNLLPNPHGHDPLASEIPRFDIDSILNSAGNLSLLPNQLGHGTSPPPPAVSSFKYDQHVRKIDEQTSVSEKFQHARAKSTYVFENLQEVSDPNDLLRSLFQNSIDTAIENSRAKGIDPDHLGVCISSVRLNNDILIPIREITANTADSILNRFLWVSQSKTGDGSLYGAPFTVVITTVKKFGLPTRQRTAGSGNFRSVKHNIEPAYIIPIRNQDTLCLFYAVELMRVYVTKEMSRLNFHRLKSDFRNQKERVCRLLAEAKIPKNLKEYDIETYGPILQEYYDRKYGCGIYKIFVFSDYGLYKPIWTSDVDSFTNPILVYHHNDHFDGIKTISSFFNRKCYCLYCETPYARKSEHNSRCVARCINCSGTGADYPCPPIRGYKEKCLACKKIFSNKNCYNSHLKNGFCKKSRKCESCGVIWDVKANTKKGRGGHVCAEKFCFQCRNYHNPERGCYIQKLELKERDPYRIVIYDFESEQSVVSADDRREHRVNFISATILCTRCIQNGSWKESMRDECEICGPHRTRTWSPFYFQKTIVDKCVRTDNPLRNFVRWMLRDLNEGFKTMAFAHFGGRYDMTMVFGELYRSGICPEMIRQGNRLYEMRVKKTSNTGEIYFHDSYNLIPSKLSDLVKAFGLDIEPKMFFPHMWNRPQNYHRVLTKLPPREDYLHNSMKPKDRAKFEAWYSEHEGDGFDLKEKLAEYCCSDVKILCHALVALRETFFKITKREKKTEGGGESHPGIDILDLAMTIASGCMKNFRLNHLKKQTIGIVPEKGYDRADNQSLLALKFLRWYEETHGVEIRTALSPGGEFQIGRYKLDGYIERENKRGLGLEVHGCYYHACKKCYPNDQQVLANGKTASFIRTKDEERLRFLSAHIGMKVYYECEINKMLKRDCAMRECFDNYIDCGPIKLRDAYFGGRTGPMKLFHKVKPGYKISYKDFTSLYPYTNYATKYPIGHPTPEVFKTSQQDVDWRSSKDNEYKGILKVLVLPPKQIDVSVLPVKFDDRLLFPLCRHCAIEYPEGGKIDGYSCKHTDLQRSFVSTCTHIELNKALDEGYQVKKRYRVLKYADFDDALFKDYVAEFMALKLQATGYPSDVKTENDQSRFIEECFEKFGISVDRAKMDPNPSIRTLAKLCLNSLWGRFSLRNKLSKTRVTDSPALLRQYLDDVKVEVNAIDMITDEILLITYTPKEEFIEEHNSSNVVISLWTTSAARLILLEALQKVARTKDSQVLYYDTDSVIYVHPIENDPLPTGNHLGELTDEYPEHEILEFVSAGCKNYAMKLRNKVTGEIEYSMKIRGLTLDHNTCQILQYQTFVEQVLAFGTDDAGEPMQIRYANFLRPDLRSGTVSTVPFTKIYRPVVSKGIVDCDFRIREFGHVAF